MRRGFNAARPLAGVGDDVVDLDGGCRTRRDGESTRRQQEDAAA